MTKKKLKKQSSKPNAWQVKHCPPKKVEPPKKAAPAMMLHVLAGSLIAKISGKTYSILSSDSRYVEILKLLAAGKCDEKKVEDILTYKSDTKGRIKVDVKKSEIYIDDKPMPKGIKERFMDLKRRHKPREYLLRFWDKLQKNPSKNSQDMLFKFLKHNGHVITSTGDFTAYRSIRRDWKDHHTGTMLNTVGKIISMPREKVVEDPNQTCSSGLHIAAFSYAKDFNPEDNRLVEVLVNPMDVVSVPVDYNGTKCRVCKFKVMREIKNMRTFEEESKKVDKLKAIVKRSYLQR